MDEEFVPAETVPDDQIVTSIRDFGVPPVSGPGRGGSGVRTVLIVLSCIVVGLLLICGGAGVFVWYAIQNAAAPVANVVLHPKSETSTADFERFSTAMESRISTGRGAANPDSAALTASGEVEIWLKKAIVEAAETGDSIPFDSDLFHKAVMESNFARNMPFSSKVTIKLGISISQWHPVLGYQSEVIAIDLDPGGVLAIAYVMDLKYESNPDCYQIFLAKVGEEWRMYDWRDLDYGRRKSDEYANYYTNLERPDSDGYDEALDNLAEVFDETNVYDGDTSRMLVALRMAEHQSCLPEDRPEKMLNIAWYYGAISDQVKSKAIAESLVDTSVKTGALATLADIHFRDGNYTESVVAAERLNTLIPNHPTAHYQLARSLPELGRHVQAARHCLALLRLYPENRGYMAGRPYEKLDQAGIDELVRLIAESGNDELIERDFIAWNNTGWWNPELAARIQNGVMKTALADRPVRWMVDGLLASAKSENEKAVECFSKAMELCTTASLRDAARENRRSVLIEMNDFAQLFELEPDHDQLVQELLDGYFDESLYFDMAKLALALEAGVGNQLDKPFGKLLLAIAYDYDDDDRAIPLFEGFLDWADESPTTIAEWDESDWKLESVNDQLANAWLRTNQCLKVIERWPGNTGIMSSLLQYCRGIRSPTQMNEIVQRAESTEGVPIWTRHSLAACNHALRGKGALALSELELAVAGLADNEDAVWVRDELSRWHGHLAVVQRDVSILERESAALNETFFGSMADAIVESRDVALARLVEENYRPELFRGSTPYEEDVQRLFAVELDDSVQLMHEARIALDLLKEMDREEAIWGSKLDDAVAKNILAGEEDDLLQLNLEPKPGEIQVPATADVMLVTGRKSELNRTLSGLPAKEIAAWLGSDRVWKYQSMAGPLLDELVQKHGINNRRLDFLKEIAIVQGDENPADIGSIASAIAKQFKNAGPAMEFSPYRGKGWTIDIPGQGRFVIVWRTGGLTTYQAFPPEIRAATSDGKSVLMIGFHGQPIGVSKKLFLCLPKIVNDQSVACFESNSQILWIHSGGSSLANQLKWNDRMPIETAAVSGKYFNTSDSGDFWETNKQFDTAELKLKVQESSDGVPARLRVQVGFADEILPVKVRSYDDTGYTSTVTVESPSKLRPEFKAGTKVNAGYYDLFQVAD